MVKKRTEMTIKQIEEDQKKASWFNKRKKFFVKCSHEEPTEILADGFVIGEYLVFVVNLGDEMVEVARFKDWKSVILDLDSLYKEKTP